MDGLMAMDVAHQILNKIGDNVIVTLMSSGKQYINCLVCCSGLCHGSAGLVLFLCSTEFTASRYRSLSYQPQIMVIYFAYCSCRLADIVCTGRYLYFAL